MPFLAFKIVKWALKLVVLVVVGVFVFVVVSVGQVLSASEVSQEPSAVGAAQAIVVMGEPTPGGVASADLASRLEQALSLYRAGKAPVIVVTGGVSPGSAGAAGSAGPAASAGSRLTEAAVEARFLEQQGLGAGHVVQVPGANDPAAFSMVEGALPARHCDHRLGSAGRAKAAGYCGVSWPTCGVLARQSALARVLG